MPQTYRVTDPQTGKTIRLIGDAPPTEAELNEIFANLHADETKADPNVMASLQAVKDLASPKTMRSHRDVTDEDVSKTVLSTAINTAHSMPFGFTPNQIKDYVNEGPLRAVQGLYDLTTNGASAKNAHDIISGAGVSSLPFAGVALRAPLSALSAIIFGRVGQSAGRSLAEYMHADPDQVDLAGDIGGLAGGAASVAGTGAVSSYRRGDTKTASNLLKFASPGLQARMEAIRDLVLGSKDAPAAMPRSGGLTGDHLQTLVDLWKEANPGKEPPASIMRDLRLQARSEMRTGTAAGVAAPAGRPASAPPTAAAESAPRKTPPSVDTARTATPGDPAVPASTGRRTASTPAARVPTPDEVVSLDSLNITNEEIAQGLKWKAQGVPDEEILDRILKARQLTAATGTHTPDQMRARVKSRNQTGRWPEDR